MCKHVMRLAPAYIAETHKDRSKKGSRSTARGDDLPNLTHHVSGRASNTAQRFQGEFKEDSPVVPNQDAMAGYHTTLAQLSMQM